MGEMCPGRSGRLLATLAGLAVVFLEGRRYSRSSNNLHSRGGRSSRSLAAYTARVCRQWLLNGVGAATPTVCSRRGRSLTTLAGLAAVH